MKLAGHERREAEEKSYFEKSKPIEPTIEKSDSPVSDTIERHPAYGQISASRVQHSSPGAILYGSDFGHHHFVTITIRRSELHRGLARDFEHARDELISVALSEAQWASFVSTLNSGMGTCCTIEHINREPVHRIASKVDRREQAIGEAMANLQEIIDDAKKLAEEIERGGKKTVMRGLISRIIAQFSSHSGISYLAKAFAENVEATIEKAKVEVNAYVESRIHRAGLAALKDESSPISLLTEKKEEKKP